MQLSMKAKSFTFSDKFTIWDEDGNDKYYVVGSMFGSGSHLHIRDTNGNEVASIREKIITLKPKYYIYVGEEQIGQIVKETTLFKSKYKVSGVDWVIKGDIDDHKYSIMKDKVTIVSVRRSGSLSLTAMCLTSKMTRMNFLRWQLCLPSIWLHITANKYRKRKLR